MKTLGKKLWGGWKYFAEKVALVNEHILLGVVYFVLIGVYAVLYDLTHFFKSEPKTMWRKFEHQPTTLEDLEKQF